MRRRGGPGGGPAWFLSRMDRNGNGMLDPDEMHGRMRMMLERMADDADLDLSRPIPLEKIGEAFERMRNRRSRDDDDDRRSRRFGRDRDDDDRRDPRSDEPDVEPLVPGFGESDLFEPVPGFGTMGERFAVTITQEDRTEATRTLRRYDRNRDGILDQEEIRRGRWRNDPLQTDRNRDGNLTLNELALRYAVRRNEQGESDEDDGRRSGRGSSSDRSSRGSNDDRSDGSDRRRRIVEMLFGRYDRDRNGTIEGEELESFRGSDRFDRNDDGKVTREEAIESMSGMRSGGRSGRRGGGSGFYSRRDEDDTGERGSSDARGSSSSNRKSYRRRTPSEKLAELEDLPEWFSRTDANEDGQVMMSEYASSWSERVAADFAQFDLNHDGIITPEECLKAKEAGAVQGAAPEMASLSRDEGESANSNQRPGLTVSDSGSKSRPPASNADSPGPSQNVSARYIKFAVGVIERFDSDNDGMLSESEWNNMPQDVSGADKDGDGRLTPKELAALYANRQ
jgi:Ca2+-binding EF-hand superfamily protein